MQNIKNDYKMNHGNSQNRNDPWDVLIKAMRCDCLPFTFPFLFGKIGSQLIPIVMKWPHPQWPPFQQDEVDRN